MGWARRSSAVGIAVAMLRMLVMSARVTFMIAVNLQIVFDFVNGTDLSIWQMGLALFIRLRLSILPDSLLRCKRKEEGLNARMFSEDFLGWNS